MAATPLTNSTTGYAPFHWPPSPKPLQTWYRIFGSLPSPSSSSSPSTSPTTSPSPTPLIILHGGPGFPHNYLLPHRHLTDHYSTPLIFYDQIGSGLSTHLPETASSSTYPDFWTMDIFHEQLRQLLTHLGIEGKYDILGHSWGGMMGSDFAAKRPEGLRRLVLVNAASSKAASIRNRGVYRGLLPEEMRRVLDRVEREGSWERDEEGKKVMGEFGRRFVCMVEPEPEDLRDSIKAGEDETVAFAMGDYGVDGNPFVARGYMANWGMEGKAKMIEVQTLVINGVNEFASGDAVKPFLDEIPDVRLVTIEGTTHSPQFEKREEYMKVVGDFLTAP